MDEKAATVKHTAGPWTRHPYSDSGDSACDATDTRPAFRFRDIVIGSGETIIATVHQNYLDAAFSGYPHIRSRDEQDANMRLIAAAPELYDVLLECADVLDNYSDVTDGEDGQPRANAAMAMLSRVNNVLAKVEGQ
jgi:hypothetical protein